MKESVERDLLLPHSWESNPEHLALEKKGWKVFSSSCEVANLACTAVLWKWRNNNSTYYLFNFDSFSRLPSPSVVLSIFTWNGQVILLLAAWSEDRTKLFSRITKSRAKTTYSATLTGITGARINFSSWKTTQLRDRDRDTTPGPGCNVLTFITNWTFWPLLF